MIYLNHVLKKKENIFLFIYFSTRSTFLTAQNSFINGAELKKITSRCTRRLLQEGNHQPIYQANENSAQG